MDTCLRARDGPREPSGGCGTSYDARVRTSFSAHGLDVGARDVLRWRRGGLRYELWCRSIVHPSETAPLFGSMRDAIQNPWRE